MVAGGSATPVLRLARCTAFFLSGAGCSLAPRLSPPTEGFERARIATFDTRCRRGACTTTAVVGDRQYHVERRARYVSAEAAAGRPERSRGRRIFGAIGGTLVRGMGVQTTHVDVGSGRITVADSAGMRGATCDIVWIREETRERAGDSDSSSYRTVASGGDCAVHRLPVGSVADSALPSDTDPGGGGPQWRFRWGISPAKDSLATYLDTLWNVQQRKELWLLERFRPGAESVQRYAIEPDSAGDRRIGSKGFGILVSWRWEVKRPDGSVAGALFGSLLPADADLEIHRSADDEEAAMLRVMRVILREPFTAT